MFGWSRWLWEVFTGGDAPGTVRRVVPLEASDDYGIVPLAAADDYGIVPLEAEGREVDVAATSPALVVHSGAAELVYAFNVAPTYTPSTKLFLWVLTRGATEVIRKTTGFTFTDYGLRKAVRVPLTLAQVNDISSSLEYAHNLYLITPGDERWLGTGPLSALGSPEDP